MPQRTEDMNNPAGTRDEVRASNTVAGPVKPKPVSAKFVVFGVILLVFVGYLIYDGVTDPPGPPAHGTFDE